MASAVPYINDQQPTQSHVLPSSFELEPEIYGKRSFNLDKNLDILTVAENLALEAKCLTDILRSMQPADIREQFQIELRKIDPHDESCSTFRMSLRVDPVIWFKYHRLNNNDAEETEKLYEIGCCYVDKVKNETEHYPKVENENDIKRIPIDNSISQQWCKTDRQGRDCPLRNGAREPCRFNHYKWCFDEYAGTTGVCKTLSSDSTHSKMCIHFSKVDQLNEPVYYQCRFSSININRQKVLCRFHADPNFWIYKDQIEKLSFYPYFIVSARSDATPVITLNPVKQCLNEEYVQTSDAWQAVLLTLTYMKKKLRLDKLPLNRIYINFGKWMQQKVDNPMHRFCHAHINIVLPHGTIEKMTQSYKPNEDKVDRLFESKKKKTGEQILFPPLVGSILPPKSHRLDDSCELIKYMNDHMAPLKFRQNQNLKRTISILKEKLDELEEENKILRRAIHGSALDADEPDDDAQSTAADDVETSINEKLVFEGVISNNTDE